MLEAHAQPKQDVPAGSLARAHSGPRHNLAEIAWIPVTTADGKYAELSLAEALLNGHEYAGLACADPLEYAALSRYLIALTYLVHAHDPARGWHAVGLGKAPFPRHAVDAVLGRLADHLWLFHPTTPFLQQPRLRDAVTNAATLRGGEFDPAEVFHNVGALTPGGSGGWFTRTRAVGQLSPAQCARALVIRHFMSPHGNEMFVRCPERVTRMSSGGVGFTSVGASTQFFRTGPTLAATLAVNLVQEIVDDCAGQTFFEAPEPVGPPSRLWLYTFSTAATYLIEPDRDEPVWYTLRGRHPYAASAQKALLTTAKHADPHVVWAQGAKASTDPKKLILDPNLHQYDNLAHALALTAKATPLENVVTGRRPIQPPREHARGTTAICLKTSGATMGPQIASAARISWEASGLVAPKRQRLIMLGLLRRIGGASGSLSSILGYQVRQVVDGGRRDPSDITGGDRDRGLVSLARGDLFDELDDFLRRALAEVLDGSRTTDLPAAAEVTELVAATLTVFERRCAPFSNGSRQAVAIARGTQRLSSAARRILT
ncbi:type I-E CRISPR-associated protein Cse1/CasA [Nocardioides sp. GY 10113]|uniref:type I-E CRISPR-associated protein Cse1/CasA n=1 Tax=Nocardioides sp. GY 10113 TaxID=2569761 RepID=UPI001458B1F2|nr:type I-E CRISPR-associated protein Cse1/CasA [Nocardioides sp. GY 10113]